ncbi:MAG: complex I NDUFA9 subunit family protein [Halorhodospira halophila]|uniref:complex I NDUFA9 subunit family protein n=1 Tax=Halorhodospira TaxID=85108 RepID=UPI001EE84986|nr:MULTISPECIES: complex I NDUFA9 subunit family protein [Halorhodospira]MCC3750717.1 complex I NDUFA9 subunit family protein [Halorhodospira halophila]MCG5532558.1 complex I NDUFA9 subunit family protein [Halorhodospira sp. 9621]MCG5538083.1 complex I NDUFA9 subunit family protein [Halorhodospira sp. 9622]
MDAKTVCIVGGTGFVGMHVANRLAGRGYAIRALTRRYYRGRDLLPFPGLRLIEADVHDERQLVRHFSGCHAVINLAGAHTGRNGPREGAYREVHVDLARRVLSAARRASVPRYLHMSAVGAHPDANSLFLRTKGEGEQLVRAADPEQIGATVLRPSVIFGSGDRFLNRFAGLLRFAPGVFFLPTPDARFQPVFAGDVGQAVINAMENPRTAGRAYELCGPQIYTLRELVEYVAELRGLRRRVVGLNDSLSQASARVLGWMPGRPYTLDQYRLSATPSCCAEDGLAALGIQANALEAIAPNYLGTAGRQAQYQQARREAGR